MATITYEPIVGASLNTNVANYSNFVNNVNATVSQLLLQAAAWQNYANVCQALALVGLFGTGAAMSAMAAAATMQAAALEAEARRLIYQQSLTSVFDVINTVTTDKQHTIDMNNQPISDVMQPKTFTVTDFPPAPEVPYVPIIKGK